MSWAWTPRRLRAATWIVHSLGADGAHPSNLAESLMNLPLAGEVDSAEFESARDRLLNLGLVSRSPDLLEPVAALAELCEQPDDETTRLLLTFLLEYEQPLWLSTATGGGDQLAPELIPDEVDQALISVFPDPDEREAFLLARARVVDTKIRSEIGAEGEVLALAECKVELEAIGQPELARRVRRVSVISDELGYDISAPWPGSTTRHLEVKSTVSTGNRVTVYLSRNEAEVGLVDPSWALLVVRVRSSPTGIIGWLSAADLAHMLPTDAHKDGKWQSVRLRLTTDDLQPGLPPLRPATPAP